MILDASDPGDIFAGNAQCPAFLLDPTTPQKCTTPSATTMLSDDH
jgi:hypothetical protein